MLATFHKRGYNNIGLGALKIHWVGFRYYSAVCVPSVSRRARLVFGSKASKLEKVCTTSGLLEISCCPESLPAVPTAPPYMLV